MSDPVLSSESFPRQKAMTRGFRLGAPRAFAWDRGGDRVAFLRSAGGRESAGDLWCAEVVDGAWRERLVCSARSLAAGDIPADELARRERLREVTSGITAFSVDTPVRSAVFALDGVPYIIDLATEGARAVELAHPGPCIDPRISPDGRHVAFVHDRSVYVVAIDAHQAKPLLSAEGPDVAYGLANFIAAEEMERHRGFWWLRDSSGLIVERYDESAVQMQWIADPAVPRKEPVAHRYPAAGTANPQVSLFLAVLSKTPTELCWDTNLYPYLATVSTNSNPPIISVLNRAQTHNAVFDVDVNTATLSERVVREQQPWVTLIPGVPALDGAGCLIEVLPSDGTFRLHRDGVPMSPVGIHVDAVLDVGTADDSTLCISIQREPTTSDVASIDANGEFTVLSASAQPDELTSSTGWNSGSRKGALTLLSRADLSSTRSSTSVYSVDGAHTFTNNAEVSTIQPQVHMRVVGERNLRAAVLLPQGHTPGTALPVICSPYGGPHAQRVISAAAAFTTEQWLADQGFAVVVVDGRGTPGRGPDWEFAVHGNLADPVLADQVDALHALAKEFTDFDLTRVGIRGWSFGGYLAALAVLERPDVFHAAVAGAPVTEWRLYDTGYTERYLGMPVENSAQYDNSSLLTKADLLTRPLLMIHGLADDNVVAAHTLQMSSALLAAGRMHNVLPLSGVTHMTPQEIVAENLLLTEVEFFRTHLASD